ncbi:hypothetical protein [Sporolactobacillus terrae]|uniref:Uncharacterized protein n=1 Tax=Sporolactobacillus terrae TaxID=269673 RepID=A0A5K7WYA6_9BACL|nr:hypothetical protein [Sporolactobacillus terrae]BBN97450.1 hypothetical protein St703_01550 [Sporolactobacillus terrae]
MNSRVYYDSDVEGRLYPLWYTLEGSIDWDKPTFYFPVDVPFERVGSVDLDDGVIGCTVHVEELLLNYNRRDQLGVNLEALRIRIAQSIEPDQIRRLIFQISDMEELLQIGKKLFEWS